MRTVAGLSGEEKEYNAYRLALSSVKSVVIRFGIFAAFAFGFIYFSNGVTYCIGFWVGGAFVQDQRINPVTDLPYSVGDVLTVFFSVTMGAFSISLVSPGAKAIAQAKSAGAKIFAVIDRKSEIDHEDIKGEKPSKMEGKIEFKDVHFKYPANKEKPVLQGLSLTIEPNKKIAFVGESGCGKSTCMQLIERFYDPDMGEITLDGVAVNRLNLKWLRDNIGYVGQEPVLFSTTVRENMKMAKMSATDEEIIGALKQARAWDFLEQGNKLETYVGTGGAQMSGGQKQRIAIARAILKNPRIILLDEATSALDRVNEKIIQQTLDEVAVGRTTIIIAHRLSTIRNADKIVLFLEGKVGETGSHEELLAQKGKYYEMQLTQLNPDENNQPENDVPHDKTDLDPDFGNERREGTKQSANEIISLNPASQHIASTEIKLQQLVKGEAKPLKNEAYSNKDYQLVQIKEGSEIKKEETPADKKQKKLEEKAKKKKEAAEKKAITKRLSEYSKPERKMFYAGLVAALFNGMVFPFYAIVMSFILQEIGDPFAEDFMEKVRLLALMFLVLAFASLIFYSLMLSLFANIAETLTLRLRADVYQKMLRMHIGWHDDPKNNPGSLAAKLASDTTAVNTLTSTGVGAMIQVNSAFITGMIISFFGSWRVTLVGLALSPIMIVSGKLQADFQMGFADKTDEAYKDAGVFVMEALTNMRTVAALGREAEILGFYAKALEKPQKAAMKRGFYSGLFFGLSQIGMFIVFGVIFYVGSLFMRDHGLEFRNVYQAVFGIMFATFDMGNAMQLVPDAARALNAAKSLFEVLDTPSKVDYKNPDGNAKTSIDGNIEFKNVEFKYPSRDRMVFQGLNFSIPKGHKVALVGPSGCGKSTVIQLLQRFYDIDQGEILIDGKNIKEYDIHHLRNRFGTVSQEPVVFNGTIADNIRYNMSAATEADIVRAAKTADAHDFITKNEFELKGDQEKAAKDFGNGYDRKVGSKGCQISGGQKQRIAIARALLRDPSIMLFDEATSALDPNTETIVQEAIDKAMEGHTTVTVAHRISTIRNSDAILVFRDGKIVEQGTYQELNKAKGTFYKLERGIQE